MPIVIEDLRENYSIWNTKPITPEEGKLLSWQDRYLYLVQCFSLAPSTHNTQPWALKITSEKRLMEVYLDRSRVLAASDSSGRQACLSLGCALTNLQTAANYLGFEPVISFFSLDKQQVKPAETILEDQDRYVAVARVTLDTIRPSQTIKRDLYEAIFTRRMNRTRYDSQYVVDSATIQKIKDISPNFVTVHILTQRQIGDRVRIHAIAELQSQADRTVIEWDKFSRELGAWFLPNNTASGVGMPGNTFGLSDGQTLKISRGLKGQERLLASDIVSFANNGKTGIENSSIVGIITATVDSPEYWIKSGIALERIALLMEEQGLAFAVHAGLAEVDYISKPLSLAVGSKDRAVILFRSGFAKERSPHSPRLPVRAILI